MTAPVRAPRLEVPRSLCAGDLLAVARPVPCVACGTGSYGPRVKGRCTPCYQASQYQARRRAYMEAIRMGNPSTSARPCAACGTTEYGRRRLELCDGCYERPTPTQLQIRHADGKHAPAQGVAHCTAVWPNGYVCPAKAQPGHALCHRCEGLDAHGLLTPAPPAAGRRAR